MLTYTNTILYCLNSNRISIHDWSNILSILYTQALRLVVFSLNKGCTENNKGNVPVSNKDKWNI